MELTHVVVVAILALAFSPALTIGLLVFRDRLLAEKLITYLRQNQATGAPVALQEHQLEIRKMELEAEKQTRALRAAELMSRENGTLPPGVRR